MLRDTTKLRRAENRPWHADCCPAQVAHGRVSGCRAGRRVDQMPQRANSIGPSAVNFHSTAPTPFRRTAARSASWSNASLLSAHVSRARCLKAPLFLQPVGEGLRQRLHTTMQGLLPQRRIDRRRNIGRRCPQARLARRAPTAAQKPFPVRRIRRRRRPHDDGSGSHPKRPFPPFPHLRLRLRGRSGARARSRAASSAPGRRGIRRIESPEESRPGASLRAMRQKAV